MDLYLIVESPGTSGKGIRPGTRILSDGRQRTFRQEKTVFRGERINFRIVRVPICRDGIVLEFQNSCSLPL